jgi:beta-glucosidase
VLVLSNGRPLSVNWAVKHVPAIIELWFPGEEGGTALADVLWGDCNPSGHLAITFPRSAGQVQLNFPAHPGSQARDGGQVTGPLFPFGHGLSYTTFQYANLRISPERPGASGEFAVSCEITNTGARTGDEVVQLYLRDDYSSVTTYEKELRGFERVSLAPGETKPASFTLTSRHLQLYDRNGHWTVEPGRFTVMVGSSSEDIRLRGNFTVIAPDGSAPDETPLKDEPLTAR